MMRLLSCAAIWLLVGVMPEVARAQDRVYKSHVDLVGLTVTVTDAHGQFVTGLRAGDFAIFEDGVRQELALFGSEDIPVDVALVVDTSSSMTVALPLVKQAATGLVRALRPGDRAAVIDVKGDTRIAQPLTDDRVRLETAIDRLKPRGTTALHDAIYITLRQFARERLASRDIVRRQSVIVLSDGLDTISYVAFDAIAELAQSLDVIIYTISIRDRPAATRAISEASRVAAWQMGALAQQSGGRAFAAARPLELPGIYETIARELAHQYALAYVSPAVGEHGFRRVGLRLLPPAQGTPRTRAGYVSKPSEGSKER